MKIKKLIGIFATCACGLLILASCGGNSAKEEKSEEQAQEAEMAESEEVNTAVYTGDPRNNPNFKIVDGAIITDNLPVVVDFYADWCGPCKQYSPIFHEVASQYNRSAIFVSINVDDYKEIADNYEITSIPTTVFIQPGGGVLGKETGILEIDNLTAYVNQLIATSIGDQMAI